MDSKKRRLLGFLDLSAAFDTVDHDILHVRDRLRVTFGFRGRVLDWIHSFVSYRVQAVNFAEGQSAGPLYFVASHKEASLVNYFLLCMLQLMSSP